MISSIKCVILDRDKKKSQGQKYPGGHVYKQFRALLQLIPELEEWFHIRYGILLFVSQNPYIGRRQLAKRLDKTERAIRNEIVKLEDLGYLEVTSRGLITTNMGKSVMEHFTRLHLKNSRFLGRDRNLAKKLGIKNVIIIKNKAEHTESLVFNQELKRILKDATVLGLTGGTSVKKFVDSILDQNYPHIQIVSARGSLGSKTSTQANTLAESLSDKIGAKFIPLVSLDNLNPSTLAELKKEPFISNALDAINSIDALVFGIGRADTMIERRNMDNMKDEIIGAKKAVAEAVGSFFNLSGEVVYRMETIGMKLEALKQLKNLTAICFGEEKAEAVLAVSNMNENLTLITDVPLAEKLLSILGGKNGKSSN